MNRKLAERLAAKMTIRSFGVIEHYITTFSNIEMDSEDGTVVQYAPPANLRLQMSNLPAANKHGEPALMGRDEIVLCRLGLDRNGLTRARRANLEPEDRAALEFYEGLDVLEYQARVEILYDKGYMVTAEEALKRRELSYIGPDDEKYIADGYTDVMFADEANGRLGRGHHQRMSVDLHWLRRIIRKQKPGDKLEFDQYCLKLMGDTSQTLAGDSRFITHVVFIKRPMRNARQRPLNYVPGVLGLDGRGFVIVLRIQDIRHAVETYMSQLVPFPEGRPTVHEIWLLDHPTPDCAHKEGQDRFLAQILALGDGAAAEAAEPAATAETEAAEPEPVLETEDPTPDETTAAPDQTGGPDGTATAEPAQEPAATPALDLPEEIRALLSTN